MKKSLLAASFIAALSASLIAAPAHADELPSPTPADLAPLPLGPASAGAVLTATPYKVEFNWVTPDNPAGEAYTTCDVKFLRADNSVALAAPYPASVTKLAFSFGESEMSGAPIVPGVDSLSFEYTCSTPAGETSAAYRLDSVVIPDVVPTAPTYVDVNQATPGDLSVNYGGSETIGAAALDGYQIDVLKDGLPYTTVNTDSIEGGSYVLGTAQRKTMRASALRATGAQHLPAGLYTVQVRGRNAVGLSSALSSKTIAVQGALPTATKLVTPSKVRALTMIPAKTSVKLRWQAPARGDIQQYKVTVLTFANGTSTAVRALTLPATQRGLKISGLKAQQVYQLRVAALNKLGLSAVSASHFTTKRR